MRQKQFADIILPLAVKGTFTYSVPDELHGKVKPGCRVVVQFGSRKLYSGLVNSVSENNDKTGLKAINDLLDLEPLIDDNQLKLWSWIAEYYMCGLGEVMKAAIPSGFCIESETLLKVNPAFYDFRSLDQPSLLTISTIENSGSVFLKDLPLKICNKNTIRIVNDLVSANIILAGESFEDTYKPRTETFISLSKAYSEQDLHAILDGLMKAPRQFELLSSYIRITGYNEGSEIIPVKKTFLLREAEALTSSLSALVIKGVLRSENIEVGRLTAGNKNSEPLRTLTQSQEDSLKSIRDQFGNKNTILLKGVTSSGKTEIYIHLIAEQLKKGKQVLYLLPEIALTNQIITRLEKHFGLVTGVYHSRFSNAEKVEIWNKTAETLPGKGYRLILGVRSALFLPFNDLGLVIVDEEHEGSYKQQDPSPRYNARDSAIVLAGIHNAKILLGSATPSIESYHNAMTGKYGYSELTERYGNVMMPEILTANVRDAYRKKRMISHFTPELISAIEGALLKQKQVILFQNRRGFSPYIECQECGWIPVCSRCAVKLTYHKGLNRLICHYCGHSENLPGKCPGCGSTDITTRGFGTEKVEDEIKIVFPGARVVRLDYDTTRKKDALSRVISQFENHLADILVGTQMISKGLDFDDLAVVGIMNADSMLNFPDFRAWEKSYQLLEQVSGRAGRRKDKGLVIVQTSDPSNQIIRLVLNNDYTGMYNSQITEREIFGYPPFSRLVRINVRHKEWESLNSFSGILANLLKEDFGSRLLGPQAPVITRIHTWHIKTILIKIPKDSSSSTAKSKIASAISKVEKMKGAASLRISVDVDPY